MRSRKSLLIIGAIALIGVSVLSVVTLTNSGNMKQIAPQDIDNPYISETS